MSQSENVNNTTEQNDLYPINEGMISNNRMYSSYPNELQSNTINSHNKDAHEWFVLQRMLSANSNNVSQNTIHPNAPLISHNSNIYNNNNHIPPYIPQNTQPIHVFTNNSYIDYSNNTNNNSMNSMDTINYNNNYNSSQYNNNNL